MSRAFSSEHHPLGMDLRNAVLADADDVARLLSELGYPCEIDDALERIDAILAEHGQGDFARRFLDQAGLEWAADLLADFPAAQAPKGEYL